MVGMKWRLWEHKILLLNRIRNHSVDTLCRQIYEEGELRKWPGLGQEVREICEELNIPDANKEHVPKATVKEAVFNHHYDVMKEEIMKMKKLDPIKHEDFRVAQQYLKVKSIENGRMAFRIRTQMIDKIPGNFKNKYKKETHKLKCPHCNLDQDMTQSHCLDCPAWGDIRKDLDVKNIDDLVKFFQRLLAERTKKDEEVTGLKTSRPHCTTPATGGDPRDSRGCS